MPVYFCLDIYHLHVVPTEARKEHQIQELEFYVIVISLKQLFRTKFRSFTRETYRLNC